MSSATASIDPQRHAADSLVINHLSVELKRKDKPILLLSDVSFEVEPGSVFGLIGESGSGKTMTCRAIAGALPPDASIGTGEVTIGDTAIRRAKGAVGRQRPLRVGMVFADPHASLDPLQRVGDQVAEMLRVHQRMRGAVAKQEVLRLFEEVHLPDPERTMRQYPFQLSGGMAQRAMIASVLAGKPQFLLADEPTSALDSTLQLEVLDLLARLVRIEGIGILLTTHDMAVVAGACDRIAVMYAGKIVEMGPAEEVLNNPGHPYTRLLLRARPRGNRSTRLIAIAGEPPVPGDTRHPCSFVPRCPWAEDLCRDQEPSLDPTNQVAVACHFAGNLRELPE